MDGLSRGGQCFGKAKRRGPPRSFGPCSILAVALWVRGSWSVLPQGPGAAEGMIRGPAGPVGSG